MAAIRKRRKQTEAPETGRPLEHWTTYGNGRPNHDTNGRPPKVYIHSGIIGNAIPGSENQQKPSDHDKLETSNPNRHNFQTIPKSCTANFRIMPEVKKRYIYVHTRKAPAVQEISRNVLTITGNVLTERVFRFWRQF